MYDGLLTMTGQLRIVPRFYELKVVYECAIYHTVRLEMFDIDGLVQDRSNSIANAL